MCLLVGQGSIVGALLCNRNLPHAKQYAVPCVVQNTAFFAIPAMKVDHMDPNPAGTVVSFQDSKGSVVLGKILGP